MPSTMHLRGQERIRQNEARTKEKLSGGRDPNVKSISKRHYEFLNLLRVFAILLVFNSHCDALYPVSALATGGAMGNALFFVISGFLLRIRDPFLPHMYRRLIRLYPGVLIMTTLSWLLGERTIGSFRELVQSYIWPTSFWFVGALVLFDILLYGLNKLRFTEHFKAYSAGMLLLYFAAYILLVDKSKWSVEEPGLASLSQCFKLIYYFYIYTLGYAIGQTPGRAARSLPVPAAAAFVLSFAFKALYVWQPGLLKFQFVSQFLGILFAWTALETTLAREEAYRARTGARFRGAVSVLAAASFEIYLVQFTAIRFCIGIPFPLNILLALAITLGAALVLQHFDGWAAKKLALPGGKPAHKAK